MSKRLSPQLQHNITEDAYCETHLEPTRLFCDVDQITLCSKCFQSQEHKHHMVCGIQEAAENYRKLFQEILNTSREKLEAAKSILTDERERMAMIQEEEQNFKKMIESEYSMRLRLLNEECEQNLQRQQECVSDLNLRAALLNQVIKLATELEEMFQEMLQRLGLVGRENMKKLKESEARVSEQICSLRKLIVELEKKCGEGALALLKNAKYSLERSKSLLLEHLEPAHITDLSLCHIRGLSSMFRVLQRHLTLDPETAHPCLALSEDLRTMRLRHGQQDGAGNPERLDFSAMVLAAESFTSGRHYWEVDVEKATRWQVGIYHSSADTRGSTAIASGEKVLLTGSVMGTECTLWVFPPLKRLFLEKNLDTVGVFLDCDHGQISFYNVTETSLIYNFSHCAFQGALRPVFSLCIPNGDTSPDSLTISPQRGPSCDATVSP
ncbi:probable E3 ubiquitin-protein ligase TRIML2 [Pongo abelii]|uniref:probable E3 ubiquitin-protein ligase TRIML2 n=1 Tax=Pongo abelii TaxID=9601 RepID=UPI0023E862F5|nr:probable E3 ubiquitin-protein ligase TRIML2 [Pongo abelii]XP_024101478.2 probable E3 ubiquitin-protein ligase TRIML2 [Pongo abelii]XP_054410841.1 probable E3 ubiquitin-protein ligase TRIML2 [Pongo abelii]